MNIIGTDVSKKKLDYVLLTEGSSDKELYGKTANDIAGFQALIRRCCKKADCSPSELHVILEATGPYHELAARFFYENGLRVSVVNPAQIKFFSQSIGIKVKNDRKDASVIALFGLRNNPPPWKPEPPEYRELRALLNRLNALETDIRREKNRLEKVTHSHSSESVTASLKRTVIFLEKEKKALQDQIRKHIGNHPDLKKDRSLLQSVPGIGPVVSAWMTLLLQNGKRFGSAPGAASYIGLIPTEHRSGSGVLKRPRLSKAGPPVFRAKLYMAAVVAIRYNPDVKDLYERLLKRGKTKMSALGAAMRKLVHICFGVIRHQSEYKAQIQN